MASTSSPGLVLIAEAHEACAPLVQVLLEEGFPVLQRRFSTQVNELLPAAGEPPALMVLQPPAPVDGSLVQSLRRRDPELPLLLLLEHADEELRARLLDAGADDVLVQPCGLREFVARCRAILRRSRRSSESRDYAAANDAVLQVGPIRLDRRECRVSLSGEEVNLTPREFRLLECFMQQPGRALTREQLIEQVWGADYSGDSKSVDVHVLWLRRKLDHAGPQPQLFITVRGIGYRLDPPRS
jgi:two-component system phosphate regulon response regulator PhoB